MNPQQIDEILRRTLDDRRFSRAEKQALGAVLADLNPDARGRAVLRSRAFEMAAEAMEDPAGRAVVEWLEAAVKVFAEPEGEQRPEVEVLFSPEDDCASRIVRLFESAKLSADACVFTVTDDRIADAMIRASRRGVTVRLLSDDDKSADLGSDIARIRAAGIETHVDRSPHHMHHKFAIFDRATLLTGSYNWTRGAARDNRENFLITSDPRLVGRFAAQFERLFREFGR